MSLRWAALVEVGDTIRPLSGCLAKPADDLLDLGAAAGVQRNRFQPERGRQNFNGAPDIGKAPELGVDQRGDALDMGSDLQKRLDPLAAHLRLERAEAGDIAAGLRQALHEAGADRIRHHEEHDRDRLRELLSGRKPQRAVGDDDVGRLLDEVSGVRLGPLVIASVPADVQSDIAAVVPAETLQSPAEAVDALQTFSITFGVQHHQADDARTARRLRRGREGPSRRTGDNTNDVAPPHSITSSAWARSVAGTAKSSARAVFKLTTSSSLADCSTGRSPGRSPLMMRST